ncbi:MAG: sigma-70 family RNA polymerase sigma factor [Verrucomicrobia bacterium]|nr:sigma-70 family RNA polymerase sigma factor [Verrucomicrobiota bacterium]
MAASAPGVFVTTHWSVVLSAGESQSPQAHEAITQLCQTYWYPLYAFVRRQGYGPHDAQDLTQEFFARLLQSHFFACADRRRGRFRSFLLASMKHFLMHEWEKARALKRGGGQHLLPLDAAAGETRYTQEPTDNVTPDKLFERRWALTLLERVLDRLREDCASTGKAALFDALKPTLTGERSGLAYAEVGARLGLSEGAVKVAVHRLRHRYGQLLREEIAHTVASPAEVDEELRYLLAVLSQ